MGDFKLQSKLKAQRTEVFSMILEDLAVINKCASVLIEKSGVSKAEFTYKKIYFEKTLKQIQNFLLTHKVICVADVLGLTVTMQSCIIKIFKEEKK